MKTTLRSGIARMLASALIKSSWARISWSVRFLLNPILPVAQKNTSNGTTNLGRDTCRASCRTWEQSHAFTASLIERHPSKLDRSLVRRHNSLFDRCVRKELCHQNDKSDDCIGSISFSPSWDKLGNPGMPSMKRSVYLGFPVMRFDSPTPKI